MRLLTTVIAIAVCVVTKFVLAADPGDRVVLYSPDKSAFVAWYDHDAGPPVGLVRPIVFRLAKDPHDYFSLVSTPRSTQAAWNSKSSGCILADAPDNGGPRIWLILRQTEEPAWRAAEIEPFNPLADDFHRTNPGPKAWRPSVLKLEWESDTVVVIRGYCNLGTYLIRVDTRKPGDAPRFEKLSDQLLEESK